MPRYIDTDKTDKIIEEELGVYDTTELKEMLYAFPTEDVEPVIHAHWIVQKKRVYISSAEYPLGKPTKLYIPDFYTCSICGRKEPYQEPYCHCGAKMDEDEKG